MPCCRLTPDVPCRPAAVARGGFSPCCVPPGVERDCISPAPGTVEIAGRRRRRSVSAALRMHGASCPRSARQGCWAMPLGAGDGLVQDEAASMQPIGAPQHFRTSARCHRAGSLRPGAAARGMAWGLNQGGPGCRERGGKDAAGRRPHGPASVFCSRDRRARRRRCARPPVRQSGLPVASASSSPSMISQA